MFMTSYVIHGVFLIPIIAYVADFFTAEDIEINFLLIHRD